MLWAAAGHGLLSAQTAAPARAPSELAACGAAYKQGYTELAQAHELELRRHAMHPLLVARLQGLGGRMQALRAVTARAPRNAVECDKNTQALVEVREQLERIAGSPAQLDECTAANRQTYTDMQTLLLGLQTGGQGASPPMEAAAGRLDQLRAAVARQGMSLADCRQLGTELGDARAQVQRLAPPAAAAGAAPPAAAAPPRSAAAAVALAAPAVATAAPAFTTSSEPAAAAPAPTAPPSACREAQARSYNEVAQAYARVVGGGTIPVEWMAPLQGLSERLMRLHAVIADTAAPGWDCDAVARALARERADLAALTRR